MAITEKQGRKRLFFGAEVVAAWPAPLPKGRMLDERARHMTLAFLGEISFSSLQPLLSLCPRPKFRVGLVGKSDQLLFLPKKEPHVVAAHVHLFEGEDLLKEYQKTLLCWLKQHAYPVDEGEFLPHVTLARTPFSLDEWKEILDPIPLFISAIHLYESVGNLTYHPLWSHPLLAPFEELDHTADIAFRIIGENMEQLHLHAQIALAFAHPPLLNYMTGQPLQNSLDEIIISLNELVAVADQESGTPFKAVSFHGNVTRKEEHLEWEMIVDV
ncbi:MAG: hypothetical protein ACHQT8_02125 [Chlamydiales bacterium]